LGPPPRVGRSNIVEDLVIRVEITAGHSRVLMARHTLEQVQLDTGVRHPGQRGMSQPVPHKARQPKMRPG
jgi:hypothetical protein